MKKLLALFIAALIVLLSGCSGASPVRETVAVTTKQAWLAELFLQPDDFAYTDVQSRYIGYFFGNNEDGAMEGIIGRLAEDDLAGEPLFVVPDGKRIAAISSTAWPEHHINGTVWACVADYASGTWKYQACPASMGSTIAITIPPTWDIVSPTGRVYFGAISSGPGNGGVLSWEVTVYMEDL